MNKKIKINPTSFTSEVCNIGQGEGCISVNTPFIKSAVEEYLYSLRPKVIMMLAIVVAEEEGEEEEKGVKKKVKKVKEKVKEISKKEAKEITAETEKELKALLSLPLPPYVTISPAPGLGKMSPAELCNYTSDRFIRINAVSAFAGCSPSVAFCQAIYIQLQPLASIGKGISESDRTTMETLQKQLSDNFGNTLKSCGIIANGNLPLFSLIKVKNKGKGVRNHKRLGAPTVTLNTKLGAGTMGVKCKPVEYAKSYTVTYGLVSEDISTYKSQTGTSSQVIKNLKLGELMNFIMCANTGTEAGFPSAPQPMNVPYN